MSTETPRLTAEERERIAQRIEDADGDMSWAALWACDEVDALLAARDAQRADLEARVRAMFGPEGDYAPCDQASWSCSHAECEVAVAVLDLLDTLDREGDA